MNQSVENCTMKQRSSFDYKMKRKVDDEISFTPGEREVARILLSMQKIEDEKRRTYNNNAHPAPQINIPTIPGITNNDILFCCKPFVKKLYPTDLEPGQSRLLLNKNHVKTYFLPLLKKGEEDVREGIDVVVYDMQGNTFNMIFKFWSEKVYVLSGGRWVNFSRTHQLKAIEDHVTVWMFRHSQTNQLCFALSVRKVQN
ncbi:putative transcription factor B3-Domain family [Medicago truncatula]|uniref:Putative transcription factor B3-Domain family n=1 Tax=Medicago truncatula TaxID=3880 RepID=A0A396JLV8_MEDTR|nr:putative transcription factor B3-Domain family [Medicago truncatula]